MSNLHETMAAVGIPYPPARAKPTSNGFLRWDKNNRYWLKLLDGVALFGDFNTGESHQWFENDDKPLDAEQVAVRRAKMLALRKEMDEELLQQHEKTAISALNQWNGLPETGSSPYLEKKQVRALGLRFDEDALAVPIRDNLHMSSVTWATITSLRNSLHGGQKLSRALACYPTR